MDRQALYHLASIVLQTLASTGVMIVVVTVLVCIVGGALFLRLIAGKTRRRGD
jgi:hypothetical protein